MNQKTYISSPGLITPLGFSVIETSDNMQKGVSGIKKHRDISISKTPFYAARISSEKINSEFRKLSAMERFSKLEKMMVLSLSQSINNVEVNGGHISDKTALIVATTKGNIDALEKTSDLPKEAAYLPALAAKIKQFFNFKVEPVVVSNACVSGLLAVSVARRMIRAGFYEDAFVVAGDLVTKFTVAGFQSFQAMSDVPCKPYDKDRRGISLGEAAASVYISKNKKDKAAIRILGDGSCNDANHISGPSRTGEGLYRSIQSAFTAAQIRTSAIDFVSSHGTATLYNDEMEAIAFNRCGLATTPLHSLKGYFGHTLGASGLLETVLLLHMMKQGIQYRSLGFNELGVSKPLHIVEEETHEHMQYALKTASGFGGCNTAVIFENSEHAKSI